MNTACTNDRDKLKVLTTSLKFSPNNQALALEYLTAEACDDGLLNKAEPQDFSTLGWQELSGSVNWLARVRDSGDSELAARYVKLYWAIGKSTAVFPLGQGRYIRSGLCERSDLVAILGKTAAAAMEAERLSRTNAPSHEEIAWLHQLAVTEPEALEAAQSLSGAQYNNMKVLLAGILLCNAGHEKPRFLKKLLGKDSLVDRQAELLFQHNLNSLAKTAPTLSQGDRNLLAGYIRKGDPKAPVPSLSSARCAADAQSALTANASEPYPTALLGTASFLAQRQDPRARCAVRAYLALNPMALVPALLRTVPHDYFLDQRPLLMQDLPGGAAIVLLALCGSPASYAHKKEIAGLCRSGLAEAKRLSDAQQYQVLCDLLPDSADSGMEAKIISLLEKYIQSGKTELRAYLTGTGSLKDSAAQLAAVTCAPYTYPSQPANLVFHYRLKAGWDNFACRCAVVLGLPLGGREMNYILRQGGASPTEKDVSTLALALLEQELSIPTLLQAFGAFHDASYSDSAKASIRNGVSSAIQRPGYVTQLCACAKSGGVFARHTAISALDGLTAVDACATQAKAGILDCAGDSSKQIQELLLAILPAHTDWTADFAQLLMSKKAAERLLAFCNNSGPAFILGVVGAGIFGDSRVGFLLYLTHALASLLVGLLFRFYGGTGRRQSASPRPKPIQAVTVPAAFTGAVVRSLQSTLNICAFVVFFSVVLQLLSVFGVFAALAELLALAGFEPEWAQRLVAGLLELSSGVSSLRGGTHLAGRVSMAAFMLGWAGLSVHCQVLSFLVDSGLSAKTYLAGKLCHGLIAAGLTWCLTRLFPLSAPVADYLAEQAESIAALDFSTALAASSLAALAGWLLLAALCRSLWRNKCSNPPHYRV